MKKFLGISVVAILAILPMTVNATPVAGDPGNTDANGPVADHSPKYSLAESDGSDSGLVTAGYVKGAYNATIKAINTVATTVAGKQDALTTEQQAAVDSGITSEKVAKYDNLVSTNGNFATQNGVVATIGDATVNSTFSAGTVTGSATGDVSSTFSNGVIYGAVTLPVVSTWGGTATNVAYTNSVTGTAEGTVSSTFSNGAVTGTANGTVTSTISAPVNYNNGTSGA